MYIQCTCVYMYMYNTINNWYIMSIYIYHHGNLTVHMTADELLAKVFPDSDMKKQRYGIPVDRYEMYSVHVFGSR